MYYDFSVLIPKVKGKIYPQKRKDVIYINYEYDRIYKSDKKYNVPKRTTIGKVCKDNPDRMYPNPTFFKYFPDYDFPEKKSNTTRSSCLRVGTYLVIKKIIEDYELDSTLEKIVGNDARLFLDLAAYTIITENNQGQYYPDYAYHHPLLTKNMVVYSDSKISTFLNHLPIEKSIDFLNEWNKRRDHREKIYISYDSTNKSCDAGDIDLAEYGRAKLGDAKPVFNYAIAYDNTNNEPLFYEEYPGSIVDVSQLQHMIEKAKGYGYKRLGFILDRGYFSKANIRYMDQCGYHFVIMVKGLKSFVREMIRLHKGSFEEDRKYSIRDYKVKGKTIKARLFASDEKERYFHLFYSDKKAAKEKETIEHKIDKMAEYLKQKQGKAITIEKSVEQYFDLIYYHEGKEDECFMYGKENNQAINEELKVAGYFVIITSEKMTASEAITLYKSRDASEKLFRGDKSYLGNNVLRVHSEESANSKIFVEFIAIIIRNRMYRELKKYRIESVSAQNYLTVPKAIRELEKIEMIKLLNDIYKLDHAITKTQKDILKAFKIDSNYIKHKVEELSKALLEY